MAKKANTEPQMVEAEDIPGDAFAEELAFDMPEVNSASITEAAPVPDTQGDVIHANECIANSPCPFRPDNPATVCRGRLVATPAIRGQVQMYCPKCGKFAEGTRPSGAMTHGGRKLFDRVHGRVAEVESEK